MIDFQKKKVLCQVEDAEGSQNLPEDASNDILDFESKAQKFDLRNESIELMRQKNTTPNQKLKKSGSKPSQQSYEPFNTISSCQPK